MTTQTFLKKISVLRADTKALAIRYRHKAPTKIFGLTLARLTKKIAWIDLAEDAEIKSWFLTAARHTIQAENKKNQRFLPLDWYPKLSHPDNSQEKLLLGEILGELSKADRAIILGRYLEGKTYKELSAEINLSEEAIRKQRQRIMDGLIKKHRAVKS